MKTLLLLFSLNCFASHTLTQINVGGEKEAELQFAGVTGEPSLQIKSNILELTFKNTVLDPNTEGKIELSTPHPLVKRLSAFQSEKDTVKVSVVLNGSMEGIKERLKFEKGANGMSLKFAYPMGESSFLDSLKEEEIPLSQTQKAVLIKSDKSYGLTAAITVFSLLFFGVAVFYSLKFLKAKGGIRGTRKFLIEQLGYCPLGPKMGVSLIKIGEEFVLLGVTPGNISMLSSLPKLRDQYMDENKFERNTFKEAVQEEFNRMKT